jgi:hypothetical protein
MTVVNMTASRNASNIPKTRPRTAWIDWLTFSIVLALIALPHGRLLLLPIGSYNVGIADIFFGLLLAISIVGIALRNEVDSRVLFGPLVFFVVSAYLVASVAVIKYDFNLCVSILRNNFLPFITASFIINTDFNLNIERVIKWIAISCAISGIIAVVMHFAYPEFYKNINTDISQAMGDRFYWFPASVALFIPCIFIVPMRWFLRLPILLIVTIAVMATQSRTLILGYSCLSLAVILIGSRSLLKTIVICACVLLSTVMIVNIVFDNQSIELLLSRFGQDDNFYEAVEVATVQGRGEMFQQYFDRILEYNLIGSGLGRPYSIRPDQTQVFVSDVSLISFYFPMGIPGACLLLYFLWISWKRLCAAKQRFVTRKVAFGLQWVLCIACLMSTNWDLYSRSPFVVVLAFIIAVLRPSSVCQEKYRLRC